ncbi:hypothetical protein MRB53_015966 [Persea americana]|uniref:Uncharacterized protein n=1 Tax=Persea americana TaxID=3435 RepID=A0ACC2M252_PERAE|nr:hypothetical protein MRB53_015966 [Persea americana]
MMGQAYYMENNMMGQGYMENNMMGQSYMENTEADACGDFFDELLLDFPNEDIQGGDLGGFEGCFPAAGDVDALSGSSLSANSGDSTCSVEVDFAAGLSVPCEDMAQLEWLSNFFEEDNIKMDINSDDSIQKDSSRFQTSSPVSVLESKPIQLSPERVVPGRARSKRSRPTSFSRSELSNGSAESEPPKKKIKEEKKKKKHRVDSVRVDSGVVRKCKHCGIEKTPQWRMGPMGPKTLCNACGVRYKSGRLFPEYRPAASPTFVAAVHSNSHKKVMEMRLCSGKGAI